SVQPDSSRPWNTLHKSERIVVVRTGSAEDSDELRYVALSLASVHLLRRLDDHQPGLYTNARVDYGFPHRCALGDDRRPIHVWASLPGEPRDRPRRQFTPSVSAQSQVVRLLERWIRGGATDDGCGGAD